MNEDLFCVVSIVCLVDSCSIARLRLQDLEIDHNRASAFVMTLGAVLACALRLTASSPAVNRGGGLCA